MKIKTKIPVSREILADMETPLSVYRKLANGPYSYLFESVEGGENWARYSLIGLEATKIISIKKNIIEIQSNGETVDSFNSDDPLGYIDELQRSFELKQNEDLPIFNGGLVGYFGYDCVRYIENKLVDSEPPDQIGTPDALFMISDEVAVFDNLKNKLHLIVLIESQGDEEQANARLDELEDKLRTSLPFEDFANQSKVLKKKILYLVLASKSLRIQYKKLKKYRKWGHNAGSLLSKNVYSF